MHDERARRAPALKPVSAHAVRAGPRAWRPIGLVMFAVGWGANQFAPMLLVYRARLGVSAGTADALFGLYALGLIPGLLLGGRASDRLGRRRLVLGFAALSPLASLTLVLGHDSLATIAVGRWLAGVCSGVVFGAASAWVQELSTDVADGVAARRAAVVLTSGFGAGALVAGLTAQWLPAPLWLPLVPHVVVGVVAVVLGLRAPETVHVRATGPLLSFPRAVRGRRFLLVVLPLAPWVFGLATVCGVVLPQLVHGSSGSRLAFSAAINTLAPAIGVAIQPLAQRIEDRRRIGAGLLGLVVGAVGIVVGLLAISGASEPLVLVSAVPFGAAYGLLIVSGLRETERLAPADERGVTISAYLALTYVGFGFPYALSALGDAVGNERSLELLAGMLAAGFALVAFTSRRVRATDPDAIFEAAV